MMKTTTTYHRAAAALALSMIPLAGCSTQYAYGVGQEWQRQQCQKLQDLDERRRCEKSTATSYERYQQEAQASKGAGKDLSQPAK